ncbi:MAG: tRNA adenosine(34) deaminase TadA [Clostridiales bacterium]|nr:tRNA adenosine(34) deaminase TadA [Clostridiales bacterium]
MDTLKHKKYMDIALEQAWKAYELNEVPIGAVIVKDDTVIGKGYNLRNTKKNPLCHAEIIAMNEAAINIGDWRLEGCTLYVTVEPCPMCAGAIVQARIPLVVFGTRNKKAGCAGSVLDLFHQERLNHQVQVIEGVQQEECAFMMSSFFRQFRNKKGSL